VAETTLKKDMRSEREIIRLLLAFANRDEYNRVVLMNGSRVNASAKIVGFF